MSGCYLIENDESDNHWLGLGNTSKLQFQNPLIHEDKFFQENPELLPIYLFRRPEYVSYAVWVLCGIKLDPFQQVILRNLWSYKFPMLIAARGGSKSFMLALYSLMRCVLYPSYKVILAGSAFRQSKLIFNYCEDIWNKSPVMRSVCTQKSGIRRDLDIWDFRINGGNIYAIPIGPGGDKIRGLRGNSIIVDEFSAHNPQIVEEVIFGFGSVRSSPMENVVMKAKEKYYKKHRMKMPDGQESDIGNQLIISGTASYYFNHFYEYWKRYKSIIRSKGDVAKLEKIMKGQVPKNLNWKDFCVIRIPYSAIPEGFMDDAVIARAKSQMSKALYNKEFEAVFVEDSDGFFKRSLIDGAVASYQNIAKYGDRWVQWCKEPFDPVIYGRPERKYIMGIDPASESDNLAISILEVYPDHQRLVYMWTTNRKNFEDRRKHHTTICTDYWDFINRKIRSLLAAFPCLKIGIDTQGGGYSLMESMHSKSTLRDGESPIWNIIDHNKPKDSDDYPGLHLIQPIQFANYEFMVQSNWGLRTDLETRKLLLPQFDALTAELSIAQDNRSKDNLKVDKIYDSLEDCALEIEAMKDELSMIIHESYGMGQSIRQRWKTPNIILPGESGKLSKAKKDRYTALLIGNYVARTLTPEELGSETKDSYYLAGDILNSRGGANQYYNAPHWFTSKFGVF